MKNEKHVISRMISNFFKSYFDPVYQRVLETDEKLNRENSQPFPENKFNLIRKLSIRISEEDKKEEKKLIREIDFLLDNIRIFGCFLADFTAYYYDLEGLVFNTKSNDGKTTQLPVSNNCFVSRNVLCTFLLDKCLKKGQRRKKLSRLIEIQYRDQINVLVSNASLIRDKLSPEDLGVPEEFLFEDKNGKEIHSFLSDSQNNQSFGKFELKDWVMMNNRKKSPIFQPQFELFDTEIDAHTDFFGVKQIGESKAHLSLGKNSNKLSKTQMNDPETSLKLKTNVSLDYKGTKINQFLQSTPLETPNESNPPEKTSPNISSINNPINCTSSFKDTETISPNSILSFLSDNHNETCMSIFNLLQIDKTRSGKTSKRLFSEAIEEISTLGDCNSIPRATVKLKEALESIIRDLAATFAWNNKASSAPLNMHITHDMMISILIYITISSPAVPSSIIQQYMMMKLCMPGGQEFHTPRLAHMVKSAIKSVNRLILLVR